MEGRRAGNRGSVVQQSNPPIEDQVYIVQSQVRNTDNGSFVGLQDKNGVQYSVWDSEKNAAAYDEALESEGYICDIAYYAKGKYKNIIKLARVKQVAAQTSNSAEKTEYGSKQVSIEAQVCLKKACDMVAARPELFFDEPNNISDDILAERLVDLTFILADTLLDTIDHLDGDSGNETENIKEEVAVEEQEEIPEGGYVEEEVDIPNEPETEVEKPAEAPVRRRGRSKK